MESLAIFVALTIFFLLLVTIYSLILVLRGNFRMLERERNIHNAQVSELLDRLAHAEGRPWNLAPRPVEPMPEQPYDPENDPELQTDWKEV
jgi:hypothetical protein